MLEASTALVLARAWPHTLPDRILHPHQYDVIGDAACGSAYHDGTGHAGALFWNQDMGAAA